ncbi:hypothetical protein ABZT08_02420 [Streptomyces sp. NPDC005526]|uniref:hypothetical protein n=1 Tax=Streptomyces sp. NPDC005526 TaxID=3156885 RepID=UPI0033B01852
MSTAPHARRAARRHVCRRVLLLLLALLVPGVRAEADAVAVVTVAGAPGGGAAEQDVLDAAPRPGVYGGDRAAVPSRPAAPEHAAPEHAAALPAAAPPSPSPRLHALRCVVPRC